MALKDYKILQENLTIQNLADTPSQESLTSQQLKAKFDEFPELLRQKLNALIDELGDLYPDDSALQVMQARVAAYAAHGTTLANTAQSGHVRVDGRSITLNEAGQLVAQGAASQVASYEQALAGLDNSAVMTPLRVKQAINQGRQGLNFAISDACASSGAFTACAWQHNAAILAAATADESAGEYRLILFAFDGKALVELSSLPLSCAAHTLLWDEADNAVAYLGEDGQPGWAELSGQNLLAGETPAGAALAVGWRPNGQLAVVWQSAPAAVSLYMRQGLKLTAQGSAAVSGAQEIAAVVYAPHESNRLAAVARMAGSWRLLLLRQEATTFIVTAAQDLPAAPTALAWHPGGKVLALGFAAGEQALLLYAVPESGENSWRKLAVAASGGISGLSWQGEGHYLALGRKEQGALYELYAFDGAALLLLAQALSQGSDNRPVFQGCGGWLAVLSGNAPSSTLRVLAFEANMADGMLPQQTDFAALPQGNYLIPEQAAMVVISCFQQPVVGQYFSFYGDYPAQVTLNSGVYALEDGGARGCGLYCVMFTAENGGTWRVLPLSTALANSGQAEAAADDVAALTPYGAGLLLAKRGRRPATIIVAAADSLNAAAADFICAGQSDQLILKQAINALPASGGKLALLEGSYVFDAEGAVLSGGVYRLLEINKPNVTLTGMGKGTVIKLAANVAKTAGQQFCLIYANSACLTVRDCLFDGMKGNGNNTAKVTALSLSVYAEQSEVQNCVFRNCSEAGLASAALYAHIRGNWLHANLYGLYTSGGEATITENDFYQNTGSGLYTNNSTDLVMSNRFISNTLSAADMRGCVNSQFAMNTLIGNPNGIRMYNCSFILVRENYVRRALGSTAYTTAEKSLWVENCTDMMVVGNWLRGKEAEAGGTCARIWSSYGGSDWNPVI